MKLRHVPAVLAMLAIIAISLPPYWAFEQLVNRRLARCTPYQQHYRSSAPPHMQTYIWHRHTWLLWGWWASHDHDWTYSDVSL